MTNREIKQELNKIYQERKCWNGGEVPFTPKEIRRRESILIMQNLLYRIEDAKLIKDKQEELFLTRLFLFIKRFKQNRQK